LFIGEKKKSVPDPEKRSHRDDGEGKGSSSTMKKKKDVVIENGWG